MLGEKLSAFGASKALKMEALRYVLGLTKVGQLSAVAKAEGKEDEIMALRKNFFKASPYTLKNIWKAAVITSQQPNCENCAFRNGCKALGTITTKQCKSFTLDRPRIKQLYQADVKDVNLLLELSPADKQTILKKYRRRYYEQDNFSLDDVYSELKVWCQKFVRRKFKFITQYYWSIEESDIINELMLQAQIRALSCSTMKNRAHFLNALKRRIKQRGVNFIKKNTTKKEARITNDTENYKSEIEFYANRAGLSHLPFEDKKKRFKHTVSLNFQLNTLSLDYQNQEGEDGECDLHSVIGSKRFDALSQLEHRVTRQAILKNVKNKKYKKVVSILLGKYDKQVSQHMSQFGPMKDDKYLGKLLEFYQIDEKEFEEYMTELLLDMKIINAQNVDKVASLKPKNEILQVVDYSEL